MISVKQSSSEIDMSIVIPIMKENDFDIFLSKENSVGIYQVTGDISIYYKDGFQMCREYV
jgi:hypothetical protein